MIFHSIGATLASLNTPPLVATVGLITFTVLPATRRAALSSSLATLKFLDIASFTLNCFAVSVPGRIGGRQYTMMGEGFPLNPDKPNALGQRKGPKTEFGEGGEETAPLQPGEGGYGREPSGDYEAIGDDGDGTIPYPQARGRTLVSPSGWAFVIWGPIYAGEAIFVVAQLFCSSSRGGLGAVLPMISAPFVTANVLQSLWCASFRPKYGTGRWGAFVSPAMMAGTAIALSDVHGTFRAAAEIASDIGASSSSALFWYSLPLTLHFGWTTAAFLIDLNGAVSSDPSNPDGLVVAFGHMSALLATVLAATVTARRSAPLYGATIAWALAGCADGMKRRVLSAAAAEAAAEAAAQDEGTSPSREGRREEGRLRMLRAAARQELLCWVGCAACALFSVTAIARG